MEATQGYPNLLSEKQAAARLGVARITLLRAREAGRIRFFRVGTRVLYCEEQLTEFLARCERNGRKDQGGGGRETAGAGHSARRKDNIVSSRRQSVPESARANPDSGTQSANTDQGSLPLSAIR